MPPEQRVNPLLNLDASVKAHRNELFRYVLSPVRVLLAIRKLPLPQINPHLLLDAIIQCQKSLKVFENPDAFKMGGHLGYWIARIKPFRMHEPGAIYTNEKFALFVALAIVSESMGQKSIHHKIWINLMYDLRYGSVSATAFSNQLQLLYCQEYAKAQG